MGVIHHPKERLGAEEELARAGKLSADGLVLGWTKDDEYEYDEYEYDDDDDDEEVAGPDPLTRAS